MSNKTFVDMTRLIDVFDTDLIRKMAEEVPIQPFGAGYSNMPLQPPDDHPEILATPEGIAKWVKAHIHLGPERRIDVLQHHHPWQIRLMYQRTGILDAAQDWRGTSREVAEIIRGRETFTANEIMEIDHLRSPDRIIDAIRRIMHKSALHEEDEWLRVDGKIRFDPHKGEL